jgi:hypothetical protein
MLTAAGRASSLPEPTDMGTTGTIAGSGTAAPKGGGSRAKVVARCLGGERLIPIMAA